MVDSTRFRRFTKYGFAGVRGRGGAGRVRRTTPDQVRGPGRVNDAELGAIIRVIRPMDGQDGPENHANHKLRSRLALGVSVVFSLEKRSQKLRYIPFNLKGCALFLKILPIT